MTGKYWRRISVVALFGTIGFTTSARAQAVDLLGLGINANFESPDQADGTGETHSTLDLGPGWTYHLLAGASNDFGVQDPADGYYGPHPLPAPFDGRQIGYFNLDPYSVGEAISAPVGTLVASQNYTLNVAVGARNATTWSDVRYLIGLRTSGGADLGTFASIDMDPGFSATNISDLQYTLSAVQAAGHVGEEVSIVIRGVNLGTGTDAPAFTQPNFDNVRLSGTLAALNSPLLTINRATGAITLSKTGASNLNITGYSLTSDAGSFDSANWLSVASHYDKNAAPTPGNGSVDSDDAWTILGNTGAGTATELSEGEVNLTGPHNGGTLATGSPINLGSAWLKTPYEDVVAKLSLADGSVMDVAVTYMGTAIPSGDLTGDGNINGADWTAFKNGQGTDFSTLSTAQGYLKGDLNGDGSHDLSDFLLFRTAYDAVNGAGSFASLVGVPEPSTLAMLAIGGMMGGAVVCRRSKREVRATAANRRTSTAAKHFALLFGVVFCGLLSATVQAQEIFAHWSFDSDSLTKDGSGNITGVLDSTGNHNATVGSGTFLSTDSVVGQFGEGLRFNGDNHLEYPILIGIGEVQWRAQLHSFDVGSMAQRDRSRPVPRHSKQCRTGETAVRERMASTLDLLMPSGRPERYAECADKLVTRPAPNGTDIYARTVTTPSVNDGSWHMLTWTFDTTSGALDSYFDGAHIQTFNSAAANFQMADSTSAVGAFGFKADNSLYLTGDTRLDEITVFDGALDQGQITNLFQNPIGPPTALTLRVDPVNGHVLLRNDDDGNATSDPITFNSYRITSAAGSLDSVGWTPIAGQSISGFPVGNGSGNGWESGPGSSSKELTEWYLTGDSTLNKGDSVDLGFAYDESMDAQDLVVRYLDSNGSQHSAKVVYAAIGGVPGDYSGNGVVDAEDYTIWRDHLGQAYQLTNEDPANMDGQVTSADYTFWKSHFGDTLSGSGSLAESATAAPEPSTGLLLLFGGSLCAGVLSKWPARQLTVAAARLALMLVTALAVIGLGQSARAAYTIDRLYHFGDDSFEHASENADVGCCSEFGQVTNDSMGPSGSYVDLASNGATGLPKYINVSTTGANLAQVRPGASNGNLGILFDGVDDYLSGFRFGYPSNAAGTKNFVDQNGTPLPGPNNYDGVYTRGFQLWVYPNSAGNGTAQHVVMDTRQHGLRINNQGQWALVYNNAEVDSNVDVNFDQWSHVMVAMPATLPNQEVLYVNGEAIAARQSNYTNSAAEMAYLLTVGANTGNTTPTVGTSNYFNGVLDELNMFVWGSTYDVGSNTFTDLGQFNYATDNEYAAGHLTGVAGDVNQDTMFTQADVNAFVAGWLSEKTRSMAFALAT